MCTAERSWRSARQGMAVDAATQYRHMSAAHNRIVSYFQSVYKSRHRLNLEDYSITPRDCNRDIMFVIRVLADMSVDAH